MNKPPELPLSPVVDQADEINLLDLLIVFAKRKRLVIGLPIIVAAVAAMICFFLPKSYTATARAIPPQQSQSAMAGMLAQFGGVAGLIGGGASSLKGPNDLYIGMLKSRSIADPLIERFELLKTYRISRRADAYKRLREATTISSGKDGIIVVEVDDADPDRAAALANAYVEEFLRLTGKLAITEASQRRLFFERQFAEAKDNLTKAELSAREALQTGGLVKVDDQGRAMIVTTARLRGEITAKEVQIGAMRTYASDGNPDLQRALKELESMRRELGKIEGVGVTKMNTDSLRSQSGGDSLGRLRDVKYNEVVFEILARQFEMAKIEEAKESPVIQVLDRAIPPDRPSKPNLILIVSVAALLAALFAMVLAFFLESFQSAKANPEKAARLQALKRHLSWR